MATSFEMLAITCILLGCVGAGFVVGINIIAEWFPAKETGYTQGLYAGLGNFGSAVAAITLPTLALAFGGPDGWRWAIGTTGVIALGYTAVRGLPPYALILRSGVITPFRRVKIPDSLAPLGFLERKPRGKRHHVSAHGDQPAFFVSVVPAFGKNNGSPPIL